MRLNNNQAVHHRSVFRLALIALFSITLSIVAKLSSAEEHNIHIRTLAASCAACHGTNGNSHSITPVLAGLDAHYFSTQMLAFKHGDRASSSTVMHHHASGLTDEEIQQLADFFSKQVRSNNTSLKPQTLEKNNE